MEESVALDFSKQKQFVKSVRGIKKLLKKKTKKLDDVVKKTELIKEQESTKKPKSEKPKKKKVIKEAKITKANIEGKKHKIFKKRAKRGLVYLSHIPHGFYEHQMTEYFKQFGVVTNARVIRSSRTGNSKGYAFVEFKEPSVAEIVAETMNNYLMGKRLIKAVYIPPEKQKINALRKNWNNQNNPTREHTLKMKKVINADKSDQEELLAAEKLLSNLSRNKKKMKVLGIDYDFFMPVDIPDGLTEKVEKMDVIVKDVSANKRIESKEKVKDEKKIMNQQKKVKNEPTVNKNKTVNLEQENKNKKPINKNAKDTKSMEKKLQEIKNVVQEFDTIKQTNKQKKLKETDVKAHNFININNSDDDYSDESVNFDSDEFEKMIEDDDDNDENEDLSSADESVDLNMEIIQKKKYLKKLTVPIVAHKDKGTSKTTLKNKQGKEISKVIAEKRKTIINAPVTQKKVKFEKQNKKTLNKVIKKKK